MNQSPGRIDLTAELLAHGDAATKLVSDGFNLSG